MPVNMRKQFMGIQMSEDIERKIQDVMAKLSRVKRIGDYGRICEELTQKRLRWYAENRGRLELEGSDVRKAYTLLLLRYMGLRQEEVPIVYEDEKKIVWRSRNFCPVLEACVRLGLDTRDVCRQAEEKPVQELISKINPRLRFSRNYEKIRPYSAYCEEVIELV